ncbi:MAG: hypothetical protein KBS66_02275 [Eubacterium sp.]|nr:hypothetical protein [Candidatus Colimonas fimequi]
MATMEYKCPTCGGALEFNIKEQKLKCPYCDSVFEIADFADKEETKKGSGEEGAKSDAQVDGTRKDDKFDFDTEAGSQWADGEMEALNVFLCESCGGEIVGDDNLASARCPYCDSIMVRKEKLSGALRPDVVIPFKLEKARAKEEFKKHLLGKKLLDLKFVNENKIDEIKGVYVPFWLFDVSLDADMSYRCTNSSSHRSGDYMIYETAVYEVNQSGSIGFDTIPVDGSSKMADDLMESLEPFDYSEAVPFQTAYLAGYMADKYDVTVDDSIDNIKRRVRGSTGEIFRRDIPGHFDSVDRKFSSIRLKDSEAKYALYPVWILTVKWHNKIYTYAMNGQTGKFVGDTLPEDKAKANRMRWINTGIITAIGTVIGAIAGFMF